MEQRLLQKMAYTSLAFMFIVIGLAAFLMQFSNTTISADAEPNYETSSMGDGIVDPNSVTGTEITGNIVEQSVKEKLQGESYIYLSRPPNEDVAVTIKDIYMKQSVQIMVENLHEKYYDIDSIQRYCSSYYYRGETLDTNIHDVVQGITISYIQQDNHTYKAIIGLALDHVYIQKLHIDDKGFYIDLMEPHKVYDKVIVIDAGHGGGDGGTHSLDYAYNEKDTNLLIAKYVKELLDQTDIKVYYTRLADEKVYLRPRVQLANEVKADYFVSIHCNAVEYASLSYIHGTEVLWSSKPKVRKANEKLAHTLLESVVDQAATEKKKTITNNDLFILNNSKVPSVIVEVAYMSNAEDMIFLKKESNLKNLAKGIYNGIINSYEENED